MKDIGAAALLLVLAGTSYAETGDPARGSTLYHIPMHRLPRRSVESCPRQMPALERNGRRGDSDVERDDDVGCPSI